MLMNALHSGAVFQKPSFKACQVRGLANAKKNHYYARRGSPAR